ncbi:hypothetical protein DPSP01_014353 [Paraphaeosphaeria sporulosa]
MATGAEEVKVPEPVHGAQGSSFNAPDWELPEEGTATRKRLHLGSASTRWAIADRFDRVLPPYKRYVGLKRRTFLLVLLGALLAVIALAVGLGVGLGNKHKDQNLPLPSNSQTFTGDLTYYNPALGACGIESNDDSPIVAVSHFTFDAVQIGSDPNQNPLCGKKIRARRRREDGKTVSVDLTVVDRCTGCQPTDIDVSPTMFDRLADHDLGRIQSPPSPRYPLPIHRTNTSASATSQGSKVVHYSEISGPFREAEALRKWLRQQRNGSQTPDYLRDGGRSKRRSEALASTPPVSPMDEEGVRSRFTEYLNGHDGGHTSCDSEHVHSEDPMGGSHEAQFSDVSLSDEKAHEFATAHNIHIHSSEAAAPLQPPPPPAPHANTTRAQHPLSSYEPLPHEERTPRTSLVRRAFSFVGGTKRRTAKYIIISVLLLFIAAFLIYVFFSKVLPAYSKLRDLKDRLAVLDAFHDTVAAKLGVWLHDGRELVDNVKDMVGDGVDKVVDAANNVLGKVRVSVSHVNLER